VVRQPARIVILAAYSFQNVRILLNSGIDGNLRGSEEILVGKYFMNRQGGAEARAVFDKHVVNGYDGPAVQRRGCEHFNGENFAETKLKELLPRGQFFLRGAFIGSPSQWLPLLVADMVPPDVPSWGAAYKEYLRQGFSRFMGLQLLVEPLPYEDKRLDLDPNHRDRRGIPICRITNPPHENEHRMVRFVGEKGQEILGQATRLFGGGKVWGGSSVEMTHIMTHDTGGTRMGASPDLSATNRYGQMWQVPNLFPVGGSLFPSMSGHNPTETIWMLSSWVGSAIAQECVDLENSEKFTQAGPVARRQQA
jgi:gluconate 2-dehydrogenase alpha chain